MRNQHMRPGFDDPFTALDWPRHDPPRPTRPYPDLVEWFADGSWPQPGASPDLFPEALAQAALPRTSITTRPLSDGRTARADGDAALTEDADLRLVEQLITDMIGDRRSCQPEYLLAAFTTYGGLQRPLAALHDSVRAHLIETDSLRYAVEPLYHQLTVGLTRPAVDHLTVLVFLERLESFVEQIERIVRIHEAVYPDWAKQAPLIAGLV